MSRLARGPSFCGTGVALIGLRMALISSHGPTVRLQRVRMLVAAAGRLGDHGKFAESAREVNSPNPVLTRRLVDGLAGAVEQGGVEVERVADHALEREMRLHVGARRGAPARRGRWRPARARSGCASARAPASPGGHAPAGPLPRPAPPAARARSRARRRDRDTTTGAPIACASTAERPKASGSVEGTVTTEAARKAAGMSAQWPTRRTIALRPSSRSARRARAHSRRGPAGRRRARWRRRRAPVA